MLCVQRILSAARVPFDPLCPPQHLDVSCALREGRCDVCAAPASEALKTTEGNESLMRFCRKLSVVTESGVAGGSRPGEQNDRRLFMKRVDVCGMCTCSRLAGQLKFNVSS